MYDVIARTACLILVGICFAGHLVDPALWGRTPLRRLLFLVAEVFFLMLVIEWASQHHRAQ